MTTKLISIGNSMGIRIPKSLIHQYNLAEGEIELQPGGNGILISTVKKSRQDWEERFAKAMEKTKTKHEEANINVPNKFDENEWTW